MDSNKCQILHLHFAVILSISASINVLFGYVLKFTYAPGMSNLPIHLTIQRLVDFMLPDKITLENQCLV